MFINISEVRRATNPLKLNILPFSQPPRNTGFQNKYRKSTFLLAHLTTY